MKKSTLRKLIGLGCFMVILIIYFEFIA